MAIVSKLHFDEFWVNDFTIDRLNALINATMLNGDKITIAHHNLHSLYLAYQHVSLKEFYNRVDYIHIDGMPVAILCKFFGNTVTGRNRVTYLDWIHPLLKLCDQRSWKIFYLGSKHEVARLAVEKLESRYRSTSFRFHSGYFDTQSSENEKIVNQINSFSPDIIFVGMGMPRQELWIKENFNRIDSSVFLPCGACFDYIAGAISTPPRWMGRLGLEWLFRLLSEPTRLYQRYLFEPLFLLIVFLKKNSKRNRTRDSNNK